MLHPRTVLAAACSTAAACSSVAACSSAAPRTIESAPAPAVAPFPEIAMEPPLRGPRAESEPAASADAGSDLNAELAWLRARNAEVATLREGTPALPALLAWVPVGERVDLWLTTGEHRCAPVIATRAANGDQLDLAIVTSERRVDGRRVRDLVFGEAGHLLTYGSGGGSERQSPDGRWARAEAGWGRSGATVAGALSEVEAGRARYDGRPVILVLSCPHRALPCASGGSRPCRDCDHFRVATATVTDLHGAYGVIGTPMPEATCDDPCPSSESADKDRADRLVNALTQPWMADGRSPAGLYQSLAACTSALTEGT